VKRKATVAGVGLVLTLAFGLGFLRCFAKPEPHKVYLHWHRAVPKKSVKIVSYNVYRSATSGEHYVRLASDVRKPNYTDTQVNSGTTYFYVVTAVDELGHESKYSNEVEARIPAAGR
jgi:fibronectin type 3 domain-containing protein